MSEQTKSQTTDIHDRLIAVYEAARGLCCGYDWNKGTHARFHRYREKLLRAVDAIEPVMDLQGKLK